MDVAKALVQEADALKARIDSVQLELTSVRY
jgi:hypothetical protein